MADIARKLHAFSLTAETAAILREKVEEWVKSDNPQQLQGDLDRILRDRMVDAVEAPILHMRLGQIAGDDRYLDAAELEQFSPSASLDASADKLLKWENKKVKVTREGYDSYGHLVFYEEKEEFRVDDFGRTYLFGGEVSLTDEEGLIEYFEYETAEEIDSPRQEDYEALLKEVRQPVKDTLTIMKKLIGLWGTNESNSVALLAEESGEKKEILARLNDTEEILQILIDWAETYRQDLVAKEDGYLNFVSAENLWGLSAHITGDGSTFSSMELKGVNNFLGRLYDIRAGFNIFRSQIETGRHHFQSKAVQKFLESPFALDAHIAWHFDTEEGKKYEGSNPEEAKWIRKIVSRKGMVAMAMGEGCERFAHALAKWFADQLKQAEGYQQGDEKHLYQPLPNAVFRFVDGRFTDFANIAASLDSVALLTTGAAAAKALPLIPHAVKVFQALQRLPHWIKFMIPGVSTFNGMKNGSLIRNLATGGVNIGCELVKLRFYMVIGDKVAGPTGQEAVGKAAVLVGGAMGVFESVFSAKMAEAVVVGKSGKVVDRALAELSEKEWEVVARKGIDLAKRQNPDIPARTTAKDVLKMVKESIGELRRQTERIFHAQKELAALLNSIHSNAEAIERLVLQHPGILNPQLVERAKAIAAQEDKTKALRELRRMVEEAQGTVRSAEARAKALSRTGPHGSQTGPHKTPPRSVTPIETAIQTPPSGIGNKVLGRITNGKIRISEEAGEAVQAFYRKQEELRATFWRRLRDLHDEAAGTWEKVAGKPDLLEAKMGPFKMTVKGGDGEYEILGIQRRMYGS